MNNSWFAPDGANARVYAQHCATLRGLIRHTLVHEALKPSLPSTAPARVLDIGGGTAVQARGFARAGHNVTVLDPDPGMLARAASDLAGEDARIRDRIQLVHGPGERALDLVGDGWDLVCCHGVLMHVQDPRRLLAQVVGAAAVDGVVSVLVHNADAMPLRAAREGRWADALALLRGDDAEPDSLRPAPRAYHIEQLKEDLRAAGAAVEDWYGVRVATDHLGEAEPTVDTSDIIRLEWELGRSRRHRGSGRLLHTIGRKRCAEASTPA